jgi:hypothetical protein
MLPVVHGFLVLALKPQWAGCSHQGEKGNAIEFMSSPVTVVTYARILEIIEKKQLLGRAFSYANPRKSAELPIASIERSERQLSGGQSSTVSDGSWPDCGQLHCWRQSSPQPSAVDEDGVLQSNGANTWLSLT